ncbi:MAG: hemolysin family protein [Treponema sp.]|jgi:CBS domain containing-hemolysin-like protein|nr:hemolysin family protein [Treponema sp.]
MDSTGIVLIVSLIILLMFSAFFSASETAYSSLNRIKIKNLAASGDKRAKKVLGLMEQYDKLLSTVLIGNNIINISSSALATVLFVDLLGTAGVGIATLVITVFVLIIGEISPKTLAKEAPESFALFAAPYLCALVFLLSPLNYSLRLWKNFIMRLFKVKPDHSVTEAELLTFVEEMRQEGGINEREEDMIKRTIEFDDITAREIFTPRIDVIAASIADSLEDIDKKFQETGFSRLPVYRETIDNITGVILLKDFYRAYRNKWSLSDIIKPVVFITENMRITKLLRILQKKKSHMAVLVDEFGGTRGIITIEDIIEELVGEIWDEHDEVVEEMVKIDENTWRVLGKTALEDLFDAFSLEQPGEQRHTIVANWVMETVGGVPEEGDGFTVESSEKKIRITVIKVKGHRVMEVEIKSE